MLKKDLPMSILSERCPTTKQKGKEHEQIQETIAYNLALRVPHRVGAKIPLPGDGGEGQRGGGIERAGAEPADELRGAGDERAGGSCAYDRANTAEAVDLGVHGAAEGQECDPGVQRVSGFTTEPVLGESLLGAGVLRRDGGVGRRDDTEVCKMAGEGGTTARGVPIQPMMNKPGQRDLPSPLWGLGFGLLWRPQSKAPPFGRGFLLDIATSKYYHPHQSSPSKNNVEL